MTGPAPAEYGWWLASRAAGVTALVCITVAVVLGLAMGGKVARRPGWPRFLLAVHEHTAIAGLVAIAVHGVTLLGDGWLKAGVADIAVPFASDHEPLWTGLGVLGGWLAVLLGSATPVLFLFVMRLLGPARPLAPATARRAP